MLANEKYHSKAGNRRSTYFFTVKQSGDSSIALQISERSKQQSGYERFNIYIQEDDLDDFLIELRKAVDFISSCKKN